jgi:hypothetical protein
MNYIFIVYKHYSRLFPMITHSNDECERDRTEG